MIARRGALAGAAALAVPSVARGQGAKARASNGFAIF